MPARSTPRRAHDRVARRLTDERAALPRTLRWIGL